MRSLILFPALLTGCFSLEGRWIGDCVLEDADGGEVVVYVEADVDHDVYGELSGDGYFEFDFAGERVEVSDVVLFGERTRISSVNNEIDVQMSLDGEANGYLWKLDIDGALFYPDIEGDCRIGTWTGTVDIER
jgi:hypothetical protein